MISVLDDVTARIQTTTLDDISTFLCIAFFKFLYTGYFVLHFIGNHAGNGLLILTTKILEKVGRKRIIMDRTDEEPYLERYYLFFKDRETFPFNIFIHKFLKSDPDDLHDHPWGFRTLILKGGYWEHTEQGKFWRKPGFTQSVEPMHKHRVELKPGCTCWTLFIPYRRCRKWGFYRDEKWIESEDYFRLRKKEKLENHTTGKELNNFSLDYAPEEGEIVECEGEGEGEGEINSDSDSESVSEETKKQQ